MGTVDNPWQMLEIIGDLKKEKKLILKGRFVRTGESIKIVIEDFDEFPDEQLTADEGRFFVVYPNHYRNFGFTIGFSDNKLPEPDLKDVIDFAEKYYHWVDALSFQVISGAFVRL